MTKRRLVVEPQLQHLVIGIKKMKKSVKKNVINSKLVHIFGTDIKMINANCTALVIAIQRRGIPENASRK